MSPPEEFCRLAVKGDYRANHVDFARVHGAGGSFGRKKISVMTSGFVGTFLKDARDVATSPSPSASILV